MGDQIVSWIKLWGEFNPCRRQYPSTIII